MLADFPTWTHTASWRELGLSMKTQTKILLRTTKKGRTLTKDEGIGLDSFLFEHHWHMCPESIWREYFRESISKTAEGSSPGFPWTWRSPLVTGLFSCSNQPLDKYCFLPEVQNSYSLEVGMGLEKTRNKLRIWEGEGWLKLVWFFFLMLVHCHRVRIVEIDVLIYV